MSFKLFNLRTSKKMMEERATKSRRAGFTIDELQEALMQSLQKSVADTVADVCQNSQLSGAVCTREGGDYDEYYNSCRRLVDYIQQHMETSSDFEEQMDRIILACHSGATGRVLNSVVTKKVWFHRRTATSPDTCSSSVERATTKRKIKRGSASARMETAGDLATSAKSVSGRKRVTKAHVQHAKRSRRATRNVVHESSEEGVHDKVVKKKAKSASKTNTRQERGKEDDDDLLLSFSDAIGELCYPDRRTDSDTKVFKERLQKSIQFVDALLCNPPPGKVCGRTCHKIRAQMCSSSTPCKNEMCRIWHDVEAHTDRCQNPNCEFKNRILLRETMHKLGIKEQQMTTGMGELEQKRAEYIQAAGDKKEALQNDVKRLELDLEEGKSELDELEATKKTFWSSLNEIGITERDDVVDKFPDFATHYEKRTPRKARKAVAASTLIFPTAAERADFYLKKDSPHKVNTVDEDIASNDDRKRLHESSMPNKPLSEHDVVSLLETINGEVETMEDVKYHDLADLAQSEEPPLPPAGPPPFRQNPELDQDHTFSSLDFSVQPLVNEFEAPTVATKIEITKVGLSEENLADMQQNSDEISEIIAGISANSPPVEPISATEPFVSSSQPQSS